MHLVSFFIAIVLGFSSPIDSNSSEFEGRYTVYFFLLDECKICKEYGPELNDFHDEYGSDQIQFVGVFPNFASKKENIDNFKEKYNINFELKTDYFKKLSKKLDAQVLPEVFVYDNENDTVIYRGRIDDRYVSIAQRRRIIKQFDLKEVLHNISQGKEINSYRTEAVGCLINFNDNL